MNDAVLVDIADGIITITINRPEARNAVNRDVAYGVCAAVDELDHRDDLRVGILTGAGGNFCAGMDLKAFLRGEVTLAEARKLAQSIVANAPMSIAASKRVVNEQVDWSLDEMFARQEDITAPVLKSEDAREGAAAFAEKRAPNWKGR